ncbi:MAG: LysM peptidoglycan-binding domain-containing protein [Salinarimonas sp.]
MPVERRRSIAIIVSLLLAAGGVGLYAASERRGDAAVTAVEEPAPRPIAAREPAPPQAPVQPATEPVVAAPVPAETISAEPAESEPMTAEGAEADAATQRASLPEAEPVETVQVEVVAPEVVEPEIVEPEIVEPETAAAGTRTETARVAESVETAPASETVVAALDPAAPADRIAEEPAPTVQDAPGDATAPADDGEDAASFDLVRVEPTGDAVIAGRTRAGATVELLRNGERHDIIVADATGAFAFIPPPLPPGTHEIALQVQEADGTARRGRQSVTVIVSETLDTQPMVALAEPGAPTRVLAQPEPPARAEIATAPAAEEPAGVEDTEPPMQVARADAGAPSVPDRAGVRIASVEAESGGGLYVSGEAAPAADVRLYLNETFVGGAEADADGAVSFAIGRGVRPGLYRVRLDEVADDGDGQVLSRAEVTFEMPALPTVSAVAEAQGPADAVVVTEDTGGEIETDGALEIAAATGTDTPAVVAAREEVRAEIADAPAPAAEPTQEVAAVPALSAEGSGEVRTATLTIPEVNTALVVRGDSLWRISRRIYGDGIRYTVIFDANQDQIRNPDLIFPGQVFVLPAAENTTADADAQPR